MAAVVHTIIIVSDRVRKSESNRRLSTAKDPAWSCGSSRWPAVSHKYR